MYGMVYVRYGVCRIRCMYGTVYVRYGACTVRCMYGTVHERYGVCTVRYIVCMSPFYVSSLRTICVLSIIFNITLTCYTV